MSSELPSKVYENITLSYASLDNVVWLCANIVPTSHVLPKAFHAIVGVRADMLGLASGTGRATSPFLSDCIVRGKRDHSGAAHHH